MPALAPPPDALLMPDLLGTDSPRPFRLCLNTSTIRGQRLPLSEIVEIAAAAGYEAIEPWVDELDRCEAEGGSLAEIGARLRDLGITVESAIGFFDWIGDDPAARAAGLVEARRSMEAVRRLGGLRIAAPAFGAHEPGSPKIDLLAAADRYRTLLELGAEIGVVPMVEVWGFSANLSRLGEGLCVAAESGRPDASLLADVYHLYKGGSPVDSLRVARGAAIGVFHVNDYPAIAPEAITDADRVYPGDGIAPLPEILRLLHEIGFRSALSLELFSEALWAQDPLQVARTGREKLEAQIRRALG